MLLSTSATGSDPEWLQSTEKTKPAGSLMLLVTWVSTQNCHLPQTLSACPKGKPQSPSTEHSPKANPTANLSQEKQSCSTVLWGGLGHLRLPTEQAPKEIPNCKPWDQTPPHLNQLHTEGHSTALQHTGNVHSEILLPGHKDKMKSVSGTAQQQLYLDTWDFLKETKACSSSTISKKAKRQTQQHRQLLGFWATTEPCFSQHFDAKSLRNWKRQDTAGLFATGFSSVTESWKSGAGWLNASHGDCSAGKWRTNNAHLIHRNCLVQNCSNLSREGSKSSVSLDENAFDFNQTMAVLTPIKSSSIRSSQKGQRKTRAALLWVF